MVNSVGWYRDDGWWTHNTWWRKGGWPFQLRLRFETSQSFIHDDLSELQLQDVVQYVTHVKLDPKINGEEIQTLFDAMALSFLLPNLSSLDLQQQHPQEVSMLSLAEVLSSEKLPNLRYLNLESNQIGDEGAKSLGLAIRSGELKNLAELNLSECAIGDEGLIALADSIQGGAVSLLPKLSSLDLSKNSITEVGMSSLAEVLSSGKLPNLGCLDMCYNEIGNEGGKSLGLAIRPGEVKNLAELKLSECGIGDEGLIALADSIQGGAVSVLPNLRSLGLGKNSITEVGMLSLAEVLSSGKLPNLGCLDMCYNEIGNEGGKSLGLAIRSGEVKSLAELKLSFCAIGDGFLIALADSVQEGLVPNLSFVDLSGNSFQKVGLLSLAEALKSGGLNTLNVLDLIDCKITEQSASALVSALSSNIYLTVYVKLDWDEFPELDLPTQQLIERNSRNRTILAKVERAKSRGCLNMTLEPIDNEGAKSLGFAIRSGELKNFAELKLSQCAIGDEGLIELADSIQGGAVSLLPNLSSLGLYKNSITEVGMSSLAEVLSSGKLPNLGCLNMSYNEIGNEGGKSLGLAIRSGEVKNLAELKLSFCAIGDGFLIALADSVQEGLVPNLSFVDLRGNSFQKVGLLSLAEALKSGGLNNLKVLDVRFCDPTKEGASALVSAFSSNIYLTVDVKLDWDEFPELDLRRQQLTKRNSRNRRILAGLETVPKVQATFGKVYLCGNPEVGKTTLSRALQRDFWESKATWERRPHVEKRTRGINISQLSSKDSKPDENPIMLQVWDMAGQEDFQLVHNAFFPDLGFAEGKATTFVVVCSSEHSLQNSIEQLEYWLRYVASSCDKTLQNLRHVFVVMNNIGGSSTLHSGYWKQVLDDQRDKFKQHLKIQTDLFLVDVRRFTEVQGLKRRLFEHSRSLLSNQEVPRICQAIQKNLKVISRQREQFPILHWIEFVHQVVDQLQEPWSGDIIEAATKYLNEAGVVIYIEKEGVRLVVLDPNWFCTEIIGKIFLPRHMASSTEELFRTKVDKTTGSISISELKKFFKSLNGEWNGAQVDDMIAILLWLGLCYEGNDEQIFLPALIAEEGTPGDPWCLQTQVEHGGKQWVMGFSVRHQENEVALAPISLWHRFQVDLAQTPKFNGERRDNDFVANKYFMTFVVDYMSVLIEVDANPGKPIFEEISILVKPRFEIESLDATERKQCQVDLADDLVERLLKTWNQVCPGVEYELCVIWPWLASCSRPKDKPDRNVKVTELKKSVQEHGVGIRTHWPVGSGDPITEDQLLSTKDKRNLEILPRSRTSGIKADAREVNDSVFELYRPENTPKIQIVFFHGLQKEDYSDAHLSAWQSGDGSTIWPQTWLVEDIPGAHVLSISYSGGLRYNSDGNLDLYLMAENLLSDLTQDDVQPGVGQVPHCPVVLVGHSIGGIVIKELCHQAHIKINNSEGSQRAKLEKFLKNIGGIFFYATPKHGSEVAETLAKKISSPLLTYIETLSKDMERLNYHFEAMCKVNYKDWLFAELGEGLPTDLGPLKAGVEPKKYWVVKEASARGANYNTVEGADHFSVCRPSSKTGRSFSKLRDFVFQTASKASDAEMI